MASVNRRLLWIGASVAVVLVVVATAYALRGRLGERGPVAASMEKSAKPSEPASATEAAGTSRAEITIDSRRQQLIGVRTVPVERRDLMATVRAVGVVRYDETRLADINLKLEGWIRDLYVDSTGAFVKAGQPLFTLYSPELVTTQNEYLLALKTRDQLRHSQLADAREHADRLVESARQRLALWDLPADQMKKLDASREAQNAIVFRSPVTGYVIEKHALQGQHVMPGQSLYKVADLSVVWVEADVYEQELPRLRAGALATVTLDAYPGERFHGKVIFIYPYVAEQTRTVKVRFAFANRGTRLKPGMYANVEIATPARMNLVIPSNALLDSGREQVVFVALGDGYFEPRPVKTGQRFEDTVEILEGLKEGELVATGAAFFLDSESQLRSSLQAYEAAPVASGSTAAARERLSITLRSEPDPPRSGDNQFEATVKTPDGKPVTDAEVSVIFFMAAMPSMNMPAMRNEAKLVHVGDGVYRGSGQVIMAGRWDVTVNVLRGGERIGSHQLSVVAR